MFIVGAARSGTTAILFGLIQATRYAGFYEGHAFDLASRLVSAVEAHITAKKELPIRSYHLGHLGKQAIHSRIVELMRQFSAGFTVRYWADKTPTSDMVRSVPVLAEAFPLARFVFMKRRGIENVSSRLRKFPTSSFEFDCREWVASMAAWRAVRDQVTGRFVEIDQCDLSRKPEQVADRIGVLLSLSAEEIERLGKQFRDRRPEATGSDSGVVSNITGVGWTNEMIDLFRKICDAEMQAYGYTYDERYCDAQ